MVCAFEVDDTPERVLRRLTIRDDSFIRGGLAAAEDPGTAEPLDAKTGPGGGGCAAAPHSRRLLHPGSPGRGGGPWPGRAARREDVCRRADRLADRPRRVVAGLPHG